MTSEVAAPVSRVRFVMLCLLQTAGRQGNGDIAPLTTLCRREDQQLGGVKCSKEPAPWLMLMLNLGLIASYSFQNRFPQKMSLFQKTQTVASALSAEVHWFGVHGI